MKRIIGLILGISAASQPAAANTLLDWMNEHRPAQAQQQSQPADSAQLLTLEPDQTEMYPRLSPNGRFLMTLSSKGKHTWISRRYSENGDPANPVTDDDRALDSAGWLDDGHVYYLSERAGGLGLWEKISAGEAMQRRIQSLHGMITQPILLSDQSIIAVRLKSAKRSNNNGHRISKAGTKESFNNWSFPDFQTEIVRFHSDGSEKVLSAGVNPALSPDGKWIAFSMAIGRSMHLFRMHPDGSELIQLTDSRSEDVQPAWSRDGQWLLFTSNRSKPDLRHADGGQWDIWRIGTNGRNLTQLTRDTARDGAPSMGLDGTVYFHSDRKISKEQRARHQLNSGSVSGFHIWTMSAPVEPQQPTTN